MVHWYTGYMVHWYTGTWYMVHGTLVHGTMVPMVQSAQWYTGAHHGNMVSMAIGFTCCPFRIILHDCLIVGVYLGRRTPPLQRRSHWCRAVTRKCSSKRTRVCSGGTRSSKTYPVNMSRVVLRIGSPMVRRSGRPLESDSRGLGLLQQAWYVHR